MLDTEMSGGTTPPGVDPELLRQAGDLGPSSAAPPPAGVRPADHPAGAPSAGGPIAPPVDYAGDARELVEFVFDGVKPAYPGIAPIYTPDVRTRLADRLGRVMEKYQLSLAAIFAKWAPEIGLLMVTVPLVQPTVQVIREQRALDREARERQAAAKHQEQPNPNAAAPAST